MNGVFCKISERLLVLIIFAKASSQISGKIPSSPLKPVTTWGKRSISDNYSRKSVGYLFTKFDQVFLIL